MDRLSFFKQGLSSVLDAASSVIGLKKAADSFVEVVDEALSNIKTDIGFHLPSIDGAIYDGGASVLDNLAAMGYSTVEVGAYNNGKIHYKTPEALKELARQAGIKITAAHLNHLLTEGQTKEQAEGQTREQTERQTEGQAERQTEGQVVALTEGQAEGQHIIAQADIEWWQEALAIYKDLGCKYIVMAKFPDNPDAATIERYATYFNTIGEMAAERNMKFCFHPSSAELSKANDANSTFEQLAVKTDINKVWFEIDTMEGLKADADTLQLIKQYGKRILLLHLHDYDVTGDSGAIDFDSIIKAGTQSGVADIFIEVNNFRLPPMNCVERSFYYIESLPSIRY